MNFYYSTLDVAQFVGTFLVSGKCLISVLLLRSIEMGGNCDATNEDVMLKRDNVTYLTREAPSLADIPDVSADCLWSQVESEQVPHDDFPKFLCQLRRIMRRQSIEVQSIDFWSYLRGELKNLCFSYKAWEDRTFRNSGLYSNRIRSGAMLTLFEDAGFDVKIVAESYWPNTRCYGRRPKT